MSATSSESFSPRSIVGMIALGAAFALWRLGRLVARSPELQQEMAEASRSTLRLRSALSNLSRTSGPAAASSDDDAIPPLAFETGDDSPASEPLGEQVTPELAAAPLDRSRQVASSAVLEAAEAALAAVSAAAAVHAQSQSIQQAASLLVGTLLENQANPVGSDVADAARLATRDSFNSAQLAAGELAAELGNQIAQAKAVLEELQRVLATGDAGGEEVPEAAAVAFERSVDTSGESQGDELPVTEEPAGGETEPAPAGAETYAGNGLTDAERTAESVSSAPAGLPSEGSPVAVAPAAAWSRVDLQVSRFTNFADLNGYREALAEIPGVRDVRIRRVHKGVLFLSIDYEGIVPLAERLQDVREHPARRVSMNGETIQVALTDEDQV
ncbi:MAG: hypothetical protein HY534_03470 [Chloroflexi bacterium]|nr:hypothetical protein [Chloroflexota bacterium]